MDITSMNSKNSKTLDLHRLLFNQIKQIKEE